MIKNLISSDDALKLLPKANTTVRVTTDYGLFNKEGIPFVMSGVLPKLQKDKRLRVKRLYCGIFEVKRVS